MKSNSYLIILSIMFFVFAGGFSVLFWGDISLAAKIGLFVLGFGSGVTVRAGELTPEEAQDAYDITEWFAA